MLHITTMGDDNVFLEGARDESLPFDHVIAVGDASGGVLVVMRYSPPLPADVPTTAPTPGVWSAEIRQLAEDVPIPWPVSVRHIPQDDQIYMLAVDIDCPDGTPVEWCPHRA